MNRLLSLSLQFCIVACCSAQARNANWVFSSGMWMSFADTSVTILPSPYAGPAPATCISDTSGQFLLLVDNTGIRNALFTPLQGATAVDLGWSTPAANYLILPKPGAPERYFIFINEEPPSARGGYVEVDLAANGGAGAAVGVGTTWYMDHVTAKLSATTDAVEQGYWIVQHEDNSDAFRTYHLSDQGMAATPVVSHAGGTYLPDTPGRENADRWGKMKLSFQGDKLAVIKHGYHLDTNALELFHFDRTNGAVNFWAHLTPQINFINGNWEVNPWFQTSLYLTGCEFDPDGLHLYVNHYMEGGVGNIYIAQMDLSDPAPDAIQSSAFQFQGIGNNVYNGYDHQGQELLSGPNRLYARAVRPNFSTNPIYMVHNIPTQMSYLSGPEVVFPINFIVPSPPLLTDSVGGFPNVCKRYVDSKPVVTSIAEERPTVIGIWPNPVTDKAVLACSGPERPTGVRWHDVMGRIVAETDIELLGPSLVLDRQALPAGMYLVEVLSHGRSIGTVRVVCE